MSTADRIDAESHKDPARLEREIDQQRADIGNIVDALENKLSPGQLFDRLVTFGKGNGTELAQNLGATLKAHPLPALLTSVGLAWLYASRNDPAPATLGTDQRARVTSTAVGRDPMPADGSDAGGDLKQHALELGDTLSDNWDQAASRVGEMSDKLHTAGAKVSATAHDATETIHRQGMRAKQGFDQLLRDNPLALGALGIALGALLGAALPITEPENQMLGKASDRVTDKARDAMRSTVAQARDTVHDATERGERTRTH